MMRISSRVWTVCGALFALLGAAAAPVLAQGIGGAAEHVDWTAEVVPERVAPGQPAQLQLKAEIADGWKMYAVDSPPPSQGVEASLDSVPGAFEQQGELAQTEPKEGYDPNFDQDVRYFEEEATLTADFAVSEKAAPGVYEIGGTVRFMICTDRMCLPPTDVSFAAPVEVDEEAPATAEGQGPATVSPRTDDPTAGRGEEAAESGSSDAVVGAGTAEPASRKAGGGLWGFLLLAVGAGLAALLTPCVFPMIPLTVSYFTKHSGNRREATHMALVYGGTIVLTFTGLGVTTALIVGAAGAQTIAANPWVNLFIGVIFVIFALSLLGLFEMRLPSGFLNYFNRQSQEQTGYAGVFFMGLTLTLVSFSCTAPFVGGLLAATAQGAWSYPVLGMVVFSAVFALPFMLFALFPRGLEALPSSGAWMNTIKAVLGFLELAAAIKFLSNADLVWGIGLISRPLAIALTVVIFFLTGMYLIGKLPLRHSPAPEAVGVGRLLAAMAFFGLSLYLLPGFLGAPLESLDAYLPPRQASDISLLATNAQGEAGTQGLEAFEWYTDDIEGAFAEAEAEGKPVFIDFTGYTCTNCRDMEANVFPRPEVAERFREDFVLLRLYTDDPDAGRRLRRYQLELTGTTALPTYAVVHPESRELISRLSGMAKADRFAEFLDEGAAAFASQASLALQ